MFKFTVFCTLVVKENDYWITLNVIYRKFLSITTLNSNGFFKLNLNVLILLRLIKLRLHTTINRFQVLPNVNDVRCQLTMLSDDVDSVFFKYNLTKAELARLIVVCKHTVP
jgi:hypothetical protein